MEVAAIKQVTSDLLTQMPMPTSEHALLTELGKRGYFSELPADPMLSLFQKHFTLMHCLYRLQQEWTSKNRYLAISATAICLYDEAQQAAAQHVQPSNHALAEYYLDWQNMEKVDANGVAGLMASFWKRFATGGEPALQAFKCLGVEPTQDWAVVQKAYRQKATAHHPDKGGSAESFAQLQNAFATLKSFFGK